MLVIVPEEHKDVYWIYCGGLKHIHPDWQLYMVLPGPGDLLDACSPYIDGYRFLQMEWWLVGKDMDIGTRENFLYS